MSAQARLETTLTANDAPFVQAVTRAESRARTFAGKVQNFFQFRGERKVARGTGLLGQQLLAAQSGMDALEASVYGLASVFKVGFGATVAVIGGIAIFKKLQEQIEAANKADVALRAELAKPFALEKNLGPEGIAKEYESLSKATETLVEKHNTIGSRVRQLVPFINPFMGGGGFTQDFLRESKDINLGRQREKELSTARVNAELEVARAKALTVNGSKREAELAKTALDYRKRVAEIELESGLTKPGRSASDLFRRLTAARIERDVAVAAVNRGTGLAAHIAPYRRVPSPGAYFDHPDAYLTDTRRMTDDGKMLPTKPNNWDWFIKHPRNFGFNKPRILLKSDEDTFYRNSVAQGPQFGPLGLSAIRTSAIRSFGAGSFMDRVVFEPVLNKRGPLSLSDKAEGAKDLSALIPLVQQLIKEFQDAWTK